MSDAGGHLFPSHSPRDGLIVPGFYTVCRYNGLAGAELVVGVTADSNNSARKLVSARGGRITFGGVGGSLGEPLGFTAGPAVPQLESTTAQISHNSIKDGLGCLPVFFMLGSNVGQCLGLSVFGGSGGLLTGQGAKAALAFCSLVAPSARSPRQAQPAANMAPDQMSAAMMAIAMRFMLLPASIRYDIAVQRPHRV